MTEQELTQMFVDMQDGDDDVTLAAMDRVLAKREALKKNDLKNSIAKISPVTKRGDGQTKVVE